jgi:hypothetical protein
MPRRATRCPSPFIAITYAVQGSACNSLQTMQVASAPDDPPSGKLLHTLSCRAAPVAAADQPRRSFGRYLLHSSAITHCTFHVQLEAPLVQRFLRYNSQFRKLCATLHDPLTFCVHAQQLSELTRHYPGSVEQGDVAAAVAMIPGSRQLVARAAAHPEVLAPIPLLRRSKMIAISLPGSPRPKPPVSDEEFQHATRTIDALEECEKLHSQYLYAASDSVVAFALWKTKIIANLERYFALLQKCRPVFLALLEDLIANEGSYFRPGTHRTLFLTINHPRFLGQPNFAEPFSWLYLFHPSEPGTCQRSSEQSSPAI